MGHVPKPVSRTRSLHIGSSVFSFTAAIVIRLTLSETERVVAMPLPLVKPVGVSRLGLPGLLCVSLPEAGRQRLRRPPPQGGEEGGGPARGRRLLLSVDREEVVTRSYLVADARLEVGLIADAAARSRVEAHL